MASSPIPLSKVPPRLPLSSSQPETSPPPPYEAIDFKYSEDPRSSSAQSLNPPSTFPNSTRTLLLVYIHGFYGNNQSFGSFPHHVHCYLRAALSGSHVIHSKIYPRYKTYKAIEIARDKFSAWLEPHQSPTTDVILVGHSMGGLLAADLVLMVSPRPSALYNTRMIPREIQLLAMYSPAK